MASILDNWNFNNGLLNSQNLGILANLFRQRPGGEAAALGLLPPRPYQMNPMTPGVGGEAAMLGAQPPPPQMLPQQIPPDWGEQATAAGMPPGSADTPGQIPGMPVSLQNGPAQSAGRPISPSDFPWNQPQGGGLSGDVLLALAGGFLSGNPGAGFTPAAQISARERESAQQRGYTLEGQKAAYNAGIASGLSPQEALGYAVNPQTAHVINERNKPVAVPFGAALVSPQGKTVYEGNASDALFDQTTLEAMAKQYRAGDTSIFANVRGGAAAQQNISNLRKEIVRQNNAAGISGEAQAQTNAAFSGVRAAQGELEKRNVRITLAAQELENQIPIVQKLSAAVDRTQYPALNKILLAAREGTGDPNVVAYGQAIQTAINQWARATNPTGQIHVHDQQQGERALQRAWSDGQVNAALNLMASEARVAKGATEEVRTNLRKQFLNQFGVQYTPRPAEGAATPSAPSPTPASAPPIDPRAIEALRANPKLEKDFDAKYGPGAARRALSQGT